MPHNRREPPFPLPEQTGAYTAPPTPPHAPLDPEEMSPIEGFANHPTYGLKAPVTFPPVYIGQGWAATPEAKEKEIDGLNRFINEAEKNIARWRSGGYVAGLSDGAVRNSYLQRLERMKAIRSMLLGETPQERSPFPWWMWVSITITCVCVYLLADAIQGLLNGR